MTHDAHLQEDEDALRCDFSDAEMEAAAKETAMSYTHQTSGQRRCCR